MSDSADSELLDRLVRAMPSQREKWLAWKDEMREFGDYSLARGVAGLALDEIVAGGRYAPDVAAAFEAEYSCATGYDEEMLRIGVFAEMCVALRAIYKDHAYAEKRNLLMSILGQNAKRCFNAWDQQPRG